MAQTLAWTSNTVPGSLTVTGNPLDAAGHYSCADSRCARCERRLTESPCPGVLGTFIHQGS